MWEFLGEENIFTSSLCGAEKQSMVKNNKNTHKRIE
jgi:hypothetical protein